MILASEYIIQEKMSKRVYISADYSVDDGDRDVIDVLHAWGKDNKHLVDYVDTAQVVSGSVSKDPDCRPCDLKAEFNDQIKASSAVIFVIGDKTAKRMAGCSCQRMSTQSICSCTPYKQNANGTKWCRYYNVCPVTGDDIGMINNYSYLKHEFLEAEKRNKNIIIVYNSLSRQPSWLPSYMKGYESQAQAFWIKDGWGGRSGNYLFIKKALGYE